MPRVGFEPTILVFELEETVHALDRAATVICTTPICFHWNGKNEELNNFSDTSGLKNMNNTY
jgi:hypothetical protein